VAYNTIYPPCRTMRDYLISKGIGSVFSVTVDWCIATAAMPVSPKNVIVVFDEEGLLRGRESDGDVAETPVVQFRIRGINYEATFEKARQVQLAMDELDGYEWSDVAALPGVTITYRTATRNRGIFPLGRDENANWVFNQEFVLVIQEIVTT